MYIRLTLVALFTFFILYTTAHAQVVYPNRGGTGTSTAPSLGEILVGQGNGTYGPQATSTLGIGAATQTWTDGGSELTTAGGESAKADFFTATSTTATSSFPNLSVTSAFNFLGTIITDVASWFNGLFDARFATKDTDDLTEGSNLYFTNARARSAISESVTGLSYNDSTGVLSLTSGYTIPLTASSTEWDAAFSWGNHADAGYVTDLSSFTTTDLAEGANLYWTNDRFDARLAATTSLPNLTITESQITDLDHFTGADITGSESAFDGWDKDASNDYDSADFSTDFAAKSTSDLTEGSNLYFTNARADARIDAQKGQADGLATLDGGGKIPVSQLPNSIMQYQGTWNADTNTPTLADGSGSTGDVYRVSVAGSQDLGSGSISFVVGDYAIYNGSTWEKADTTDAVASVNGFTGNVVLDTDDITEAGNLYYTDARVNSLINASSTIWNNNTESSLESFLSGVTNVFTNNDTIPDGNIASTIARDSELHDAVTLSGSRDYITLSGQDIIRGVVDISDDTNLTAGDHLTLTGDELSVDDAFVLNSGDSITGTLTFSGVTTDITTGTNEHLALMPNGTGNVGIGTTSPSYPVDILSTGSTIARFLKTGTGVTAQYLFGDEGKVWAFGKATSDQFYIRDGVSGNLVLRMDTGAPSNSLYIDSAGDVGIGTNNPGEKLHVQSATTTWVAVDTTDGTKDRGFKFLNNTADRARIYYNNSSGDLVLENGFDAMVFETGTGGVATEAVRIDRDGKVGIGDDTPASLLTVGSGDLFQVNSSGIVRGPSSSATSPTYSFTGDTDTGIYNNTSDSIGFALGGAQRFTFDTAGMTVRQLENNYIRFLTSGSPEFRLQSTDDPFSNSGIIATGNNLHLAFDAEGAGFNRALQIGAAGGANYDGTTFTPYLSVISGGNVGIGKTNPGAKLTVAGGDIVLRESDDGGDVLRFVGGTASSAIRGYLAGTQTFEIHSNTGNATWFNAGNVGIGTTSPNNKLHVYASPDNTVALFESGDASVNVLFADSNTTNSPYIGALTNTLYLGHGTGGLQAVLTEGGNFGIGTTSPAKKFSVNGESYLDGLIHFGNGMCMGEDTGTTTPNVTIQDCDDF